MKNKNNSFDKLALAIKSLGYDANDTERFDELIEDIKKIPLSKKIIAANSEELIEYSNLKLQIENINFLYSISKDKTIIDVLEKFDGGHSYLSNYIKGATEVHDLSKAAIGKLKMDHILFKIIQQNYFSLFNLLQYKMNDSGFPEDPNDALKWSYERSGRIQQELKDKRQSLAWFINLKIPKTYWYADEVKLHYSMHIKNFVINEKKKINQRRMHVFYQDYFEDDFDKNLKSENCYKLFWILLFEKLIGIDNKVIILKKYDELQKYVFTGLMSKDTKMFFLDYALYQNPVDNLGRHHVLAGDFTLTGPMGKKKTQEQDNIGYTQSRIFDITGSNIFYVFKNHFLSLWEQKSYINDLTCQLEELKDKSEEECFYKSELSDLLNIHRNNIDVVDFYTYFFRLCKQPDFHQNILFAEKENFIYFDRVNLKSEYEELMKGKLIYDCEKEIISVAKSFYSNYFCNIHSEQEIDAVECNRQFRKTFSHLTI